MLTQTLCMTARDAVEIAETLSAAEDHLDHTGDVHSAALLIREARDELYRSAGVELPGRRAKR